MTSQYADDTFLLLDGSELSLKETLNCFDKFHKVSGLKMNTSKTKVVWVGNKRYSDLILCPDFNLDWSYSNFKLLGIEFSLDLYTMPEWTKRTYMREEAIQIFILANKFQHSMIQIYTK